MRQFLLEHLRCSNDGFSLEMALRDHHLLRQENLLHRDLHTLFLFFKFNNSICWRHNCCINCLKTNLKRFV